MKTEKYYTEAISDALSKAREYTFKREDAFQSMYKKLNVGIEVSFEDWFEYSKFKTIPKKILKAINKNEEIAKLDRDIKKYNSICRNYHTKAYKLQDEYKSNYPKTALDNIKKLLNF